MTKSYNSSTHPPLHFSTVKQATWFVVSMFLDLFAWWVHEGCAINLMMSFWNILAGVIKSGAKAHVPCCFFNCWSSCLSVNPLLGMVTASSGLTKLATLVGLQFFVFQSITNLVAQHSPSKYFSLSHQLYHLMSLTTGPRARTLFILMIVLKSCSLSSEDWGSAMFLSLQTQGTKDSQGSSWAEAELMMSWAKPCFLMNHSLDPDGP